MGRDLRQFSRQTNKRLIIGFILLLLIVGDGLILLIYGMPAAISGLLCLLAGLAPLALLWAILNGLDWLGQRTDQW